MTIFLWICTYHVKFFRKQIKLYGTLFSVLTFGLLTYHLVEYDHIWRPTLEKIFADEKALEQIENGVSIPVNATYKLTEVEPVTLKEEIKLEAPHVLQYPELPRGCEVTSLAMLLQYNGYEADKNKLAKEIKRDPTPYSVKNGKIYFGNPYDGFVGDMYSLTTPGLGVYHGPLVELAEKYVTDEHKVVDLTGEDFEEILVSLNKKQPVLVIINATYNKLPDSAFQTWHTPSGPVDITMREHSVLITGYDKDYIYFNDPLDRQSKASIDGFIEAWEQMGKQAITIEKQEKVPENLLKIIEL